MKKYWWVIVLAIIVLLLLYYFFGGKKAISQSPGPFQGPFQSTDKGEACSKYFTSMDDFNAKIALISKQMDANPGWKAQIMEKLGSTWHLCGGGTYENCKRIDAIYVLKEQGYCIPQNYV